MSTGYLLVLVGPSREWHFVPIQVAIGLSVVQQPHLLLLHLHSVAARLLAPDSASGGSVVRVHLGVRLALVGLPLALAVLALALASWFSRRIRESRDAPWLLRASQLVMLGLALALLAGDEAAALDAAAWIATPGAAMARAVARVQSQGVAA